MLPSSPLLHTGQLTIQAHQANCAVHMTITQRVERRPLVEMAWYIVLYREKINTWLSMNETNIRGMSDKGTDSSLSGPVSIILRIELQSSTNISGMVGGGTFAGVLSFQF